MHFNASVLDSSHEGILWLRLAHKSVDYSFLACVCYLVPENSTRRVNASEYFDTLLSQIYTHYRADSCAFICGDVNSRIGSLDDFIAGVDNLPPRDIVDWKTNKYGELFSEFLIGANYCILNGRNYVSNDFTSIST